MEYLLSANIERQEVCGASHNRGALPEAGSSLDLLSTGMGDEPRAAMQWAGRPALPEEVDTVQVRWVLKRARLYGFRVTVSTVAGTSS